MIITYDTEFLDDGDSIELLSIGMVAENGDKLYRAISDADWTRASDHEWLWDNVILPHIPVGPSKERGSWIDTKAPEFATRKETADAVEKFLWQHADSPDDLADLWAFFPATDHVALYQLFGPMMVCPYHGMAMRTSCLAQEEDSQRRMLMRQLRGGSQDYAEKVVAQAFSNRPEQAPETKHHALHDARHAMALARWLKLTSL